MAKKRALGKGLSSLIKVDEKQVNAESLYLEIDKITPNKDQPRKKFDEQSLQELADSVKQYGVLEPILVMKKGARFQIIAGERRYRAAVKAGLTKVPVMIKNDLSEEEIFQIALIENLQREDINPMDAAFAFKKLIDTYNYTHEIISKKINKDRSSITNTLRLLELPKLIQDDLKEGRLTFTQARPLLGLKKNADILALREAIIKNSYSVRQIEKIVKDKKNGHGADGNSAKQKDVFLQGVEGDFMNKLKTKVMIKDNKGKGRIEIEYYSYKDIERILKSIK
jgi:ParB family chromosome partitioning protein